MLIALDNNCPAWTVQRLEKDGHTVVFYAKDEMDEDWVDFALNHGAEIFISNDLDICNILDRWGSNAAFIELPKRVRGSNLVQFILTEVKRVQQLRAA